MYNVLLWALFIVLTILLFIRIDVAKFTHNCLHNLCSIVCYLVLVAEVTQPSLGVGYEIGRAIDLKKKVLCLYRPQSGKSESCVWGSTCTVHVHFLMEL